MFQELMMKVILIQALTALGVILTLAIFLPSMVYSGETSVVIAQKQFSALLFFCIFSSGWKIGYGLYSWLVLEKKPVAQTVTVTLTERETKRKWDREQVAWVYEHMYPGRMNPFAA